MQSGFAFSRNFHILTILPGIALAVKPYEFIPIIDINFY
jgi:hypothetical protein